MQPQTRMYVTIQWKKGQVIFRWSLASDFLPGQKKNWLRFIAAQIGVYLKQSRWSLPNPYWISFIQAVCRVSDCLHKHTHYLLVPLSPFSSKAEWGFRLVEMMWTPLLLLVWVFVWYLPSPLTAACQLSVWSRLSEQSLTAGERESRRERHFPSTFSTNPLLHSSPCSEHSPATNA